jgi:integrase
VNPRNPEIGDTESVPLDAAGHRRSPVTMPGHHQGRAPRNEGLRYPADPPTIEEIVAVMRAAGDGTDGTRLRALIVILWRAGLRISEALALAETDLDRSRGAVLVRRGKGGRRREVGMDRWAGSNYSRGLRSAQASLSEHCYASSTVPQPAAPGNHQPLARS